MTWNRLIIQPHQVSKGGCQSRGGGNTISVISPWAAWRLGIHNDWCIIIILIMDYLNVMFGTTFNTCSTWSDAYFHNTNISHMITVFVRKANNYLTLLGVVIILWMSKPETVMDSAGFLYHYGDGIHLWDILMFTHSLPTISHVVDIKVYLLEEYVHFWHFCNFDRHHTRLCYFNAYYSHVKAIAILYCYINSRL